MRRLLPIAFAMALTLSFGTSDSWAKGNATSGAAKEAPAETATGRSAPSSAPAAQFDSYAQREQAAAGLETFEGGDTIVIGSTAIVVILLVVIILLIL